MRKSYRKLSSCSLRSKSIPKPSTGYSVNSRHPLTGHIQDRITEVTSHQDKELNQTIELLVHAIMRYLILILQRIIETYITSSPAEAACQQMRFKVFLLIHLARLVETIYCKIKICSTSKILITLAWRTKIFQI